MLETSPNIAKKETNYPVMEKLQTAWFRDRVSTSSLLRPQKVLSINNSENSQNMRARMQKKEINFPFLTEKFLLKNS